MKNTGGNLMKQSNYLDKNKVDYKKLHNLTHDWAKERGIVDNGNVFTQTMKLVSEYGELCDAIIKDRDLEVKDAIGDMMVVLSNIASILGERWRIVFLECCQKTRTQPLDYMHQMPENMYSLTELIAKLFHGNYQVAFSIPSILKLVAARYGLSLVACWYSAYDEIKDRKGYLNAQGNFVKEGDNGVHTTVQGD